MSNFSVATEKIRDLFSITQLLSELIDPPVAGSELRLSADATMGMGILLSAINEQGCKALQEIEDCWQEKGENNV